MMRGKSFSLQGNSQYSMRFTGYICISHPLALPQSSKVIVRTSIHTRAAMSTNRLGLVMANVAMYPAIKIQMCLLVDMTEETARNLIDGFRTVMMTGYVNHSPTNSQIVESSTRDSLVILNATEKIITR